MARRQKAKRPKPKTVLRLPDLEQWKNAVLNSLAAASSQESYGHAIDEFIGWYCSEPRLAFNRTVVLRYRFFLEQKNLAPATINVRLAAVRPHDRRAERRLRPETGPGTEDRNRRARRHHARSGEARRLRQAQTAPAVRRPKAAGGARPFAGQEAEAVAARRTLGGAR